MLPVLCMSQGQYERLYTEFGVGNGSENNTLILASLGWRGECFGLLRINNYPNVYVLMRFMSN